LSFTQEYTGAIFNYYSDLTQYLSLKDENDFLHKENTELYTRMSKESENQELFSEYIPMLRNDLNNLENKRKKIISEYSKYFEYKKQYIEKMLEKYNDDLKELGEEKALEESIKKAQKIKNFGEWIPEGEKDLITFQLFDYIPARVIKNSIFKQNNFIVLNKGEKDGVKSGMGVRIDNGVIGIVSITSENFSKVTSVLNQHSTISVVHKKTKQNGHLEWNTNNYMTATINDMPNHATIQIGDTIQTSGYSSIFPEGINIAKIISYTKGNGDGYFDINIKFLNDMNTVKNVYIINSLMKEEVEKLEIEK
jgi:rod shape-determining protein MreC